jgi:hypothetical protein
MKTKTEKLIFIMTIHLYILISNQFKVLLLTNVNDNVQIKMFLFTKRYISMLRFFQRNYMFNIYTEII